MKGQPEQEREEGSVARAALKGGDIGVHLVVCVLLGLGVGWGLDHWLGTLPWLMVAGCFLGFAAWFRMLLKVKP